MRAVARHERESVSADEALSRLLAGNERFVRGKSTSVGLSRERLVELTRGQKPYATILGCSDSRVSPEVIFDAGLGELFVIRVAGNVFSPEVAGSLQYAGVHLSTPLFVVLGHEGCGAVQAALAEKLHGMVERSRIRLLVSAILPALEEYDPAKTAAEQTPWAVEANVRWTVHSILETPEAQARLREGRMKLVGAVFDVESGSVRLLRGTSADSASDLGVEKEGKR